MLEVAKENDMLKDEDFWVRMMEKIVMMHESWQCRDIIDVMKIYSEANR